MYEDSILSFKPGVVSGGILSQQEYKERMYACTAQELQKLQITQKQHKSRSITLGLPYPLLIAILLLTLFGAITIYPVSSYCNQASHLNYFNSALQNKQNFFEFVQTKDQPLTRLSTSYICSLTPVAKFSQLLFRKANQKFQQQLRVFKQNLQPLLQNEDAVFQVQKLKAQKEQTAKRDMDNLKLQSQINTLELVLLEKEETVLNYIRSLNESQILIKTQRQQLEDYQKQPNLLIDNEMCSIDDAPKGYVVFRDMTIFKQEKPALFYALVTISVIQALLFMFNLNHSLSKRQKAKYALKLREVSSMLDKAQHQVQDCEKEHKSQATVLREVNQLRSKEKEHGDRFMGLYQELLPKFEVVTKELAKAQQEIKQAQRELQKQTLDREAYSKVMSERANSLDRDISILEKQVGDYQLYIEDLECQNQMLQNKYNDHRSFLQMQNNTIKRKIDKIELDSTNIGEKKFVQYLINEVIKLKELFKSYRDQGLKLDYSDSLLGIQSQEGEPSEHILQEAQSKPSVHDNFKQDANVQVDTIELGEGAETSKDQKYDLENSLKEKEQLNETLVRACNSMNEAMGVLQINQMRQDVQKKEMTSTIDKISDQCTYLQKLEQLYLGDVIVEISSKKDQIITMENQIESFRHTTRDAERIMMGVNFMYSACDNYRDDLQHVVSKIQKQEYIQSSNDQLVQEMYISNLDHQNYKKDAEIHIRDLNQSLDNAQLYLAQFQSQQVENQSGSLSSLQEQSVESILEQYNDVSAPICHTTISEEISNWMAAHQTEVIHNYETRAEFLITKVADCRSHGPLHMQNENSIEAMLQNQNNIEERIEEDRSWYDKLRYALNYQYYMESLETKLEALQSLQTNITCQKNIRPIDSSAELDTLLQDVEDKQYFYQQITLKMKGLKDDVDDDEFEPLVLLGHRQASEEKVNDGFVELFNLLKEYYSSEELECKIQSNQILVDIGNNDESHTYFVDRQRHIVSIGHPPYNFYLKEGESSEQITSLPQQELLAEDSTPFVFSPISPKIPDFSREYGLSPKDGSQTNDENVYLKNSFNDGGYAVGDLQKDQDINSWMKSNEVTSVKYKNMLADFDKESGESSK